ncbi:hypothetical protein ACFQFH_15025 [Halobaculum halobium]
MCERTSGAEGQPGNVVWRLYTEYADDGRRYAALGTVATLVGRTVSLVPALVIGQRSTRSFSHSDPTTFPSSRPT